MASDIVKIGNIQNKFLVDTESQCAMFVPHYLNNNKENTMLKETVTPVFMIFSAFVMAFLSVSLYLTKEELRGYQEKYSPLNLHLQASPRFYRVPTEHKVGVIVAHKRFVQVYYKDGTVDRFPLQPSVGAR